MNVLLTGASGFVGSHLSHRLRAAGHQVLPVSRRPAAGGYDWSDASLARGVRDADAVIHLAGENLFDKRWTTKQKEVLRSSRTQPTTTLAKLVAARKPSCFISSSAVGYYGASQDTHFVETSPRGQGFLADLCGEWEASTSAAADAGVRTAIVRTGVALGRGGGALAKMLLPFKLGLGGPLGSGKQWLSWVHIDDLAALFQFLLENPGASGPVQRDGSAAGHDEGLRPIARQSPPSSGDFSGAGTDAEACARRGRGRAADGPVCGTQARARRRLHVPVRQRRCRAARRCRRYFWLRPR